MITEVRYVKRVPSMDHKTDQLDAIRARIAAGDYAVDVTAVAAAILGRLAGSPRPAAGA